MLPIKRPVLNTVLTPTYTVETSEGIPPGFTPLSQMKARRRLMIGIDGLADTGKTEFALTFPPPICALFIDQGYEHVIGRLNPPPARQQDIDYRVFQLPQAGMSVSGASTQDDNQKAYKQIWSDFYANYILAISSPRYRTVLVDGDSETWDLQRLAAFGKLTQVPPMEYTNVNQARRVLIRRGFDSGKNMAFTYRVGHEYESTVKLNAAGVPKEVSERTGNYVRKGFADQDYIVQVQLRTQRRHTEAGTQFGVEITKCKPDVDLIGMQLWGSDCCYRGIVQAIYPGANPADWGLEEL